MKGYASFRDYVIKNFTIEKYAWELDCLINVEKIYDRYEHEIWSLLEPNLFWALIKDLNIWQFKSQRKDIGPYKYDFLFYAIEQIVCNSIKNPEKFVF